MEMSHLNQKGEARMVDIRNKKPVFRRAVASGVIHLQSATIDLINKNLIKKGDVLAVARIAGINAAKQTSALIPLCHNIPLDVVEVGFTIGTDSIVIEAAAGCQGKTGVEMEALTAVSVAALTIYDMCKAVDKSMKISDIKLMEKTKDEICR